MGYYDFKSKNFDDFKGEKESDFIEFKQNVLNFFKSHSDCEYLVSLDSNFNSIEICVYFAKERLKYIFQYIVFTEVVDDLDFTYYSDIKNTAKKMKSELSHELWNTKYGSEE